MSAEPMTPDETKIATKIAEFWGGLGPADRDPYYGSAEHLAEILNPRPETPPSNPAEVKIREERDEVLREMTETLGRRIREIMAERQPNAPK